jgi:hypothetical protein
MLAILAVFAGAVVPAPPPPSDLSLAQAWRERGQYCEAELGLKGPVRRALGSLERRGIGGAAARHLIRACASHPESAVALAAMNAALEAGPSPAVSIEIRKLLAVIPLAGRVQPGHRALAHALDEPERSFAEALIDDDPAPVAKLEAALAALPGGAARAARDERRICLAAALAGAGRMDDAQAALPAAPAYPAQRKAVEARIAARAGDVPRTKQLVDEMKAALGKADEVACPRAVAEPECGVVRALISAGKIEDARGLEFDDCGALADWAEVHQSPFDAYVALLSRGPLGGMDLDWLRAPRLLDKLGRPDLALDRLEDTGRWCAPPRGGLPPPRDQCAAAAKLAASIRERWKAPAATADAALLARLRAPALWHDYEVVAAPRGKAAGLKKQLAVPDGAEVVFSAVEGTRAVAVALSREVDPRGEVSAGGYVVYLSDDAGKTWRGPFHSGFAAGFPFFVKAASTAKVFDGEVLQLPVDVQEIDPASITFPPVGLRTLRQQRGRLVRIPIALLERDSDGDDLTDLLEERLGTDPNQADTDGDGTPDAWDPLPLEKGAGDAVGGRFAAAVLDRPKLPAVVQQPGSTSFHPEPRARSAAMAAWPSVPTRFIEGAGRAPSLPGRTIRLSPEALEAYAKKLGPIYPMQVDIIVDGRRAIVDVQEHWRGVTYLVEEHPDGTVTTRILSSWIS